MCRPIKYLQLPWLNLNPINRQRKTSLSHHSSRRRYPKAHGRAKTALGWDIAGRWSGAVTELSRRAKNCLYWLIEGYDAPSQRQWSYHPDPNKVAAFSEARLLAQECLGIGTLKNIKSWLADNHLSLQIPRFDEFERMTDRFGQTWVYMSDEWVPVPPSMA